jgi:hypothetical protein
MTFVFSIGDSVTVDSVVVDACFADTVITAAALATDGAVPAPGNFAGDHVSKDWRHRTRSHLRERCGESPLNIISRHLWYGVE